MIELEFGPWLPDRRDYKNPGLEDCANVIPGVNGYQPAREPQSEGVSVSGTIIGAASAYLQDGSAITMVATTTDLHVIRTSTSTASGLSLSLTQSDRVVFEQFGASVYATTKNGDVWYLPNIQTDNTFSVSPGSPPAANAVGRIGDFLVMGDLTDIDASDAPYRIRWSRYNDPQGSWVTDIAAQAGAIDLDAQQGPVTAITGGTFGIIFQRQGVSRLTYTGGSTVFRLDTFEKNRGCVAPSSAVRIGETTYYLAHDGFFRTDGTTPVPISTGRVWQWFNERVNQAQLKSVQGSIDFQKRCICWLFPAAGSDDFTNQLWYHYEKDEWGNVNQPLQWAVQGAKSGQTIEEVGTEYPNLDNAPLSLDSATFQPSGRNLKVFSSGALSELTGNTLGASFTTGDMQPYVGRRSYVTEVHPLIETSRASARIGTKERMVQELTLGTLTEMQALGFVPLNANGRYFRTEVQLPAGEDWSDAYGVQLRVTSAGAV